MYMNENEKEEQKSTDVVSSKDSSGRSLIISDFSPEENCDKGKRAKKKRDHRVGHLGYIVTSACLLMAFVLMIGSIMSPVKVYEGDVPAFDIDEDSNETRKVIYVNGVSDGGMSTAEIYTSCSETVVSISAQRADSSGIGSGFILTEDGYIATADHVVSGAEHLTVILSDGKEYIAAIVAENPQTDLALLKIDALGLKTVQRGDSSELFAGERVVAIGTPASLDYAGSVCSGEISFPKRVVKIYGEDGTLNKKMMLIQTDAPVNPGNSGCPLFDSEGGVIGIVTMKLGQNFSGIGFAIPANEAFDILDKMRLGGEIDEALISAVSVRAARLGVVAEAFEVNGLYGVRITGFISKEYDAARKFKIGDVITHVETRAVTNAKRLSDTIGEYAPGDTVKVNVYREGQNLTFEVVLGE